MRELTRSRKISRSINATVEAIEGRILMSGAVFGGNTLTTSVGSDSLQLGVSLTINAGNGNNVMDAGFNGNATVTGGSGNDCNIAELELDGCAPGRVQLTGCITISSIFERRMYA